MRIFFSILLCAAAVIPAGCNTVKGFGQDISGSASYVQEKISGNPSTRDSDAQYVKNPPEWPKN